MRLIGTRKKPRRSGAVSCRMGLQGEERCLNAANRNLAQDAEELLARFCHRFTVARLTSFYDSEARALLVVRLGKLPRLRVSERNPIACI